LYLLYITLIIHQQLWGYKVEEKLYLGVREEKRLNTTVLENKVLGGKLIIFIFSKFRAAVWEVPELTVWTPGEVLRQLWG
jgi:hypothetical protein